MNGIEWIEFNKDNPPQNGKYLCSTDTDVFIDFMWEGKWRDSCEYKYEITAYAELPHPYKKQLKNNM